MLTKIREKATGIFAWAIVIIITIPFALWGINSYFEGGGRTVVASAEGVDIDLSTYQNALSERRRVMAQVMQQNVDASFFDSREFKLQVLEGLIQNAAESSYSDRSGFRISDEILGSSIRSLPYFQVDGAFDSQRYEDLVRNAGMSVSRFEQQQRQQMISDQIRSAYTDSAFVTDFDLDGVLAFLEQNRRADYVHISGSATALDVSVSDEEARQFYEKNKQEFYTPERMQVSFIKVSVDDISREIEFKEEEIRQQYEESKGRYRNPETRRTSHILIQVPQDADDAAVASAEKKAVELTDRARSDEDFAALAREHSDDTGSAVNGGDLGVLASDVMVKPFEDAANALTSTGQVSDPVRTRFGFHVIKLTELVPEKVKPFDDVKEEVAGELKKRLAEEQFVERAETFSNLVYEQPDSLEAAAAELQLDIEQSDWFSRDSGEDMASSPRFRTIAFGEEVRLEGLNSEAFEFDSNTMVAMHRLEFKERSLQEYEEVREDIEKRLLVQARSRQVLGNGEAIVESLKSGAVWDEAVSSNKLQSVEFDGTRSDAVDSVSRELVQDLFAAPIPGEGGVHYGGFSTTTGDYVVYRLTEVKNADPGNVSEERRASVRDQLRRRQSEEFYLSYRNLLREGADIKIYEDQL